MVEKDGKRRKKKKKEKKIRLAGLSAATKL